MLNTATKVVGLLTGVVAATYLLGGAVIAMRLLFEGFALETVVNLVGQLPSQLVITAALLDVIAAAAIVGLLATLCYGWSPPSTSGGGHGRWGTVLRLAPLAVALAAPAIAIVFVREGGFTKPLLTSLFGIAVIVGALAAGLDQIRDVGGKSWSRSGKAVAAGGIWALIALTPAVMLAGSLQFADVKVCTSDSQVPAEGLLIGESTDHVLLATDFGPEESILNLPAERVVKSEYGDLSADFTCPAPAGTVATEVTAAPLGGHGSATERDLAMKLRPWLKFDREERWRPLAVAGFLAEQFADGDGHRACRTDVEPPCAGVTGLAELRGKAVAYLDIHGSGHDRSAYDSPPSDCPRAPPSLDCEGGPASVMYYQRSSHGDRWYWDYWWFMRYNDYTNVGGSCSRALCGDHEGDWEGVTVITTPSLEPEILGAVYAAHKQRVQVKRLLLPVAGTHTLAFVAEGTHATYPYACASGCFQYGGLPEDSHDGAVDWLQNSEAACAASHCVRPLPETGDLADEALPRAAAWVAWPGQWGETCHHKCPGVNQEGSPRSPGRQDRYLCPWAPTLEAIPNADGSKPSRWKDVGDTRRQLFGCAVLRRGL